jgi:phage terminase large subunit-like protein
MFLEERIVHGNHPVLKMCAGNAVVFRDRAGNRMLDKASSHGRIDGLVALTMAAGIADSANIQPINYRIVVV